MIECPDLDAILRNYLNGDEEQLDGVFGHQRFRGDTHLWGYNEKRLLGLLDSTGFSEVTASDPTDYHKDQWPCLRASGIKPLNANRDRNSETYSFGLHEREKDTV